MVVAQRIVSLVPSHTESLHALGLADRVVGRTRFCIHPAPWVDSVPAVGGTKDASLEKVLALRPDLVVADVDENPKALVDALQAAGVDVMWSRIDAVADAAGFLRRLGAACGVAEAGDAAAVEVEAAIVEAADAMRGRTPMPVFCPIWYDPWMTFDATAYPHAMLEAAGFRNVFADGHPDAGGAKYFEVQPGDVARSDAAATLLPTEPFPFHKQMHRVDTAPLGRGGVADRVHAIDGEALTWFGVRTAPGLRELVAVRSALEAAGS